LPFVVWRAAIGALFLALVSIVLVARGGTGPRLPDVGVLSHDRRIAIVVVGVAGALLNICLFVAFLRSTVAVVLICYYTFPAVVTLAAVPLYGERLSRLRLGALLMSVVGLAAVVLAPLAGSGGVVVDPVGVVLALLAAACQATFVLISGRGWQPMSSLHVSTFVIAIAVVVGLPLTLLSGQVASLLAPLSSPAAWPWILAAGIAGAAIPTTAFLAGLGIIGPSRAAILMTIEPLVGVTIAAALLGEEPTMVQIVGGAAVLVAAAILQVAPRTSAKAVVGPELGPLV
jgi:drug/metabolite transporter (DMT)-like permease